MSSPLSFGETSIRKRIEEILNSYRTLQNIPLLVVITALVLVVVLCSYPVKELTNQEQATKKAGSGYLISWDPGTGFGIDENGKLVYSNPEQAINRFRTQYALELTVFQVIHLLPPFEWWSRELYWNAATEDSILAISPKIIMFLDVYNNSFV